jgi:hypothetical protein
VLNHYGQFKDYAKLKRDRLEEARQFQYFKRDADELEVWLMEKLQTASEESCKLIYSFITFVNFPISVEKLPASNQNM